MPTDAQTRTYRIQGMTCASCVARVEKGLQRQIPELRDVTVNLTTEKAVVSGDVPSQRVIEVIRKLGYEGELLPETPQAPVLDLQSRKALRKTEADTARRHLLWAGVLTVPVFIIAMAHLRFPGSLWVQLILSTPVVFYSGRGFFSRALHLAKTLQSNMDTLIALGSGIAYVYSALIVILSLPEAVYFETADIIITLILLGRYLEARARERTGEAIEALMQLQPQTARVRQGEEYREVPADKAQAGDILLLKPGERVPVDGEVIEGHSGVDESMISGESQPVEKFPGKVLLAATINQNGALVFRATRVGGETTLARMIRLLESAQETKPSIQRLADRVAGVFVPVVLGIALLTLLGWLLAGATFNQAIRPVIAVLVIACPCSLGLATPTAIQAGMGRGAWLGILIRNAESLEKAHGLTQLVFDKTGTLTEGKPHVLAFTNHSGFPDADLLGWVAALESRSEHPLAQAVVDYAQAHGGNTSGDVTDFQSQTGAGVRGVVAGKAIAIGNESFLQAQEIDAALLTDEIQQQARLARTPLLIALDNQAAGLLAVADPVRSDSLAVVKRLHDLGIETVMLTGDRPEIAQAVARELGIAENAVQAGMLPEDKLDAIRQRQQQGGKVGMVGDGINDAPALAQADVGFAVSSGTDIALAAADITLVEGGIAKVADAVALSRAIMRIIRQNLFWAFFYNVVAIPVAISGSLNPMIAAGAMSFSSITVVLNSLRLRRYKPG